jgi:hypothetical protein
MAEQESYYETEKGPQQEIPVTPEIAKAYGSGLYMLLHQDLAKTTGDIAALPLAETEEFREPMTSAVTELTEIIKALQLGQDIKLVPFSAGYDVTYPVSTDEDPQQLPPGEIVLEGELFTHLSSAMSHRANNLLARLGYAELIPYSMPELTTQAETIRDDMTDMAKKVLPLFNTRQNQGIKITTDDQGATTMLPIQREETSTT